MSTALPIALAVAAGLSCVIVVAGRRMRSRRRAVPSEVTDAFGADRFGVARAALESIVDAGSAPPKATIELAEIAIMDGDHDVAEPLLRRSLAGRDLRRAERREAQRLLSLLLLQTDRYADASEHAGIDPYARFMQAFGTSPYAFEWGATTEVVLPFLQSTEWELPRVALELDGHRIEASIDTGGDMLSVPSPVARTLGITPLVSIGRGAVDYAWGRASRLDLGPLSIASPPVAISALDRPIVGVGLLRQFAVTIDYPGRRLVARPRGTLESRGAPVPFRIAGTHLMIADGSLNGRAGLTVLVDSGLELDDDVALLAPRSTLDGARVHPLDPVTLEGWTAAGETTIEARSFVAESFALGGVERRHVRGMAGWMPGGLDDPATLGFGVDLMVSHQFLRHYRWSIDYDAMTMWFDRA